MKRYLLPISTTVVSILILVGGILVFGNPNSKVNQQAEPQVLSITDEIPNPEKPEYYWREGCPHCAKVDEFLSGWEHKNELDIEKIDAVESFDTQKKFLTRAASCGIDPNQAGVPLVYTPEGECKIGEVEVIEYFGSIFEE